MDRRSLKKGSAALPVSASSDRVYVTKSKTRERRFRSLQDIYMNSPRGTLEDVQKLSKMTEEADYPKSNRLNGKSGEGPSKKRKYKSMKISESGLEAERENHYHVEVSSKRNSTSKEKQPQSKIQEHQQPRQVDEKSRSSIKGKEKMCSTGRSSIRTENKQHVVPLEIIGQMTNPNPNPDPSSRSVIWQIPIAVRTEGPLGKTCLPASCVAGSAAPMSDKYSTNSAVIRSIPDQESQSIVVAGHIITSSDEKIQSSVVPTNSINATGQNAKESTGPSSSSSSTGARKLRLFGFNIDPTATQTCQVTSIENGLHNNQIDFNGGGQDAGGQDAGGHLPHHTIIAAQPNMINEFGDHNRRLSAAASPVPRASGYLPLVVAAPANINDTVGYYNYPLPAAAAAPVFMNGLSGFVPPGVAPAGNIIIFQCLPAQSFTSHQLGSFNSQAVTISPTPSWQSGVPASSSRPIRPTPRRFLPPPS